MGSPGIDRWLWGIRRMASLGWRPDLNGVFWGNSCSSSRMGFWFQFLFVRHYPTDFSLLCLLFVSCMLMAWISNGWEEGLAMGWMGIAESQDWTEELWGESGCNSELGYSLGTGFLVELRISCFIEHEVDMLPGVSSFSSMAGIWTTHSWFPASPALRWWWLNWDTPTFPTLESCWSSDY